MPDASFQRPVASRGGSWDAPGGGTRPSHGVASCELPDSRCLFATPEALKRVARGREAIPRETAAGIINPGGVAAGNGDLRTAFGVRAHQHARPRVGAVAPTRGYRLQCLRRTGGRAVRGFRRVGAPGLQSGFWELPFHSLLTSTATPCEGLKLEKLQAWDFFHSLLTLATLRILGTGNWELPPLYRPSRCPG